ncbi:hypothetical protein Dda_7038 [Drechslerella dactyloides]|uniref:Uncharacterized protein n=1 Tax=Drechslerella dactyloides TaxID=74499 RepID=A0AAD6IT10_DREDA|nr:hypothetical protein Dda_7038 [Drechslerella dactyloides]
MCLSKTLISRSKATSSLNRQVPTFTTKMPSKRKSTSRAASPEPKRTKTSVKKTSTAKPAKKQIPPQWVKAEVDEEALTSSAFYLAKSSEIKFRGGVTYGKLRRRKYDSSAKRAWAVQSLGSKAITECDNCQKELGPFSACKGFLDESDKACGNCLIDRRQCFGGKFRFIEYPRSKASRLGNKVLGEATEEEAEEVNSETEQEREQKATAKRVAELTKSTSVEEVEEDESSEDESSESESALPAEEDEYAHSVASELAEEESTEESTEDSNQSTSATSPNNSVELSEESDLEEPTTVVAKTTKKTVKFKKAVPKNFADDYTEELEDELFDSNYSDENSEIDTDQPSSSSESSSEEEEEESEEE